MAEPSYCVSRLSPLKRSTHAREQPRQPQQPFNAQKQREYCIHLWETGIAPIGSEWRAGSEQDRAINAIAAASWHWQRENRRLPWPDELPPPIKIRELLIEYGQASRLSGASL